MSREIEEAKQYAILLQELSTQISMEARVAFDRYQELTKKRVSKPKKKSKRKTHISTI
jgi:hypothetical protein